MLRAMATHTHTWTITNEQLGHDEAHAGRQRCVRIGVIDFGKKLKVSPGKLFNIARAGAAASRTRE